MFDIIIKEHYKGIYDRYFDRPDREISFHILALLSIIIKNQHKMDLTQQQLADQLNAIADQADKAKGEILTEIQKFEDELKAGQQGNGTIITTTAQLDAALARIKASVQGLDDINPDAPADGGSTTPPDGGSTTPPDSGSTTPPDSGTTTPPDSTITVPPTDAGATS